MSGSFGSVSHDATKPSRMLSGGSELLSGWIADGGVDDWMVPRAPASTRAFVRGGISAASRYSGEPSGSFEPRLPSRANPLLAPGMSTQAPLKAALLACTSAIAAWTAARFFSATSFATGCPPCARPGIEKGSALRMTTGPRWIPLVPAVKLGVPKRRCFSAGFSIFPNHGPRLNPTGSSPTSSSLASRPNCLSCQTAHSAASLYELLPVSRPPNRLLA